MILSRLELAPGAGGHDAFWKLFQDGYHLHRAVWSLFADRPDRERDFLYRLDLVQGKPRLFTLSGRPPAPSPLWRVSSRPFAPQLAVGDRLRFDVRVNPVVTRERRRHDVVMDAKTALKAKGVTAEALPPQGELVQQAGTAWLQSRAAKLGVELEEGTLRADGYELHRFAKRGKAISLATLDLSGVLRVTAPDTLLEQLAAGIGPAKGFGCGLMLIARA